jgi:predicted dehydrogenase
MRNCMACGRTELAAVCDAAPERLARVRSTYPWVATETDAARVFERGDVDAVVIATPVHTHAPMAAAALRAGKHVLVEKPMTASVREGEELLQLAEQSGRVLMVDHTFVYHGAVRKIKEILDSGELGEIYFIDSVRINLGLFQHDVNVVWDLAAHDLAITDFLLGRAPRCVSAFGVCHADSQREIEDVAHVNLDYGGNLVASFHVNWLSPVKIRHFMIGGSRKSIVYNDLEVAEKVKVYDRGITVSQDVEARRGVLINYRTGDVWSPNLDQTEPLARAVAHFAECIIEGKRPLTDGESGLRVVRMLEKAQRSIKSQGARIDF